MNYNTQLLRHIRKLEKKLRKYKGGVNIVGNKVFVSGLAILLALPVLTGNVAGLPVEALGAVVTIVGAVLTVIDR